MSLFARIFGKHKQNQENQTKSAPPTQFYKLYSSSQQYQHNNGNIIKHHHSLDKMLGKDGKIYGNEHSWDNQTNKHSHRRFRGNQTLNHIITPNTKGLLDSMFSKPTGLSVTPIALPPRTSFSYPLPSQLILPSSTKQSIQSKKKKSLRHITNPKIKKQRKRHQQYRKKYETKMKELLRERRELEARIHKVQRKLKKYH